MAAGPIGLWVNVAFAGYLEFFRDTTLEECSMHRRTLLAGLAAVLLGGAAAGAAAGVGRPLVGSRAA